MKGKIWVTALFAIFIFYISVVNSYAAAKRYMITNYGAVADSMTINTKAIQAAIDECHTQGGGVVVVPKGVFISGALFLKQGVNLLVEKGGTLKGSVNPNDYPQVFTRWEGVERTWTAAFINANDVQHITVSGEGTIDGSGDVWNSRARQVQSGLSSGVQGVHYGRPRLICFQNCNQVTIANLQLHNQAVWCLHILYCTGVEVKNLQITANHDIPSSDGIDVDSSTGVHITGTYIDVNDDCISIKSGKDEDGLRVNRPSKNILVEHCTFGYGHGGVAMGSETSGGIRDVTVSDCIMEANNWAPIRFKTQPSRSGVVENITYRNIKLNHTRKAFEFNMAWRMVNPAPPAKVLPVVRNIKIINVSGITDNVGDMHGLEGSPITNVVFENCDITADKGFLLEHTEQVDLSGLKMKVKQGEAIIHKN